MEFDIDALQELAAQDEQEVGACAWTCAISCPYTRPCPATCHVTGA